MHAWHVTMLYLIPIYPYPAGACSCISGLGAWLWYTSLHFTPCLANHAPPLQMLQSILPTLLPMSINKQYIILFTHIWLHLHSWVSITCNHALWFSMPQYVILDNLVPPLTSVTYLHYLQERVEGRELVWEREGDWDIIVRDTKSN